MKLVNLAVQGLFLLWPLRWVVLVFLVAVTGFSATSFMPPALPVLPPILPRVGVISYSYKATNNATTVRIYSSPDLVTWSLLSEFLCKTNATKVTNGAVVTSFAAGTNYEFEVTINTKEFFKATVSNSTGERPLP